MLDFDQNLHVKKEVCMKLFESSNKVYDVCLIKETFYFNVPLLSFQLKLAIVFTLKVVNSLAFDTMLFNKSSFIFPMN